MNKEKLRAILIAALKELAFFMILLGIAWFTSWKAGWTDTSITDNLIGVTVGWITWKLIMFIINKRKKKNERETNP